LKTFNVIYDQVLYRRKSVFTIITIYCPRPLFEFLSGYYAPASMPLS